MGAAVSEPHAVLPFPVHPSAPGIPAQCTAQQGSMHNSQGSGKSAAGAANSSHRLRLIALAALRGAAGNCAYLALCASVVCPALPSVALCAQGQGQGPGRARGSTVARGGLGVATEDATTLQPLVDRVSTMAEKMVQNEVEGSFDKAELPQLLYFSPGAAQIAMRCKPSLTGLISLTSFGWLISLTSLGWLNP
ncbi:hypothetical protein HaLaN_13894 [Haematococcus lacustris]|uniref:Uncharacterized protein n=1 Tax=Haematococcus lacustris TaxID=44745 RepID=A0A699Z742_HAELA|nr:hypothetical protein HaLaN_13894 [Haematococcus lacustris]